MRMLALLLIAAALAAPAGGQAPGGPAGGPYFHQVMSASSPDGLQWTHDGVVLLDHASVPAALALPDGRMRVYYVDASRAPENVNCAEVTSDLRVTVLGCTIAGRGGVKAVDPSVVVLPDGRTRLYYYASGQSPGASGLHRIRAAAAADGVHFEDEGEVYAEDGLVDPDVFWSGRDWLMFVFSLSSPGTIVAKSDDGLRFSYLGKHPLEGWGTTAPVAIGDGRLRLYAFNQGRQDTVKSFVSVNGLDWTMEEGVRLSAPSGKELTDPFVVRLATGGWRMVYKVSDRRATAPGR